MNSIPIKEWKEKIVYKVLYNKDDRLLSFWIAFVENSIKFCNHNSIEYDYSISNLLCEYKIGKFVRPKFGAYAFDSKENAFDFLKHSQGVVYKAIAKKVKTVRWVVCSAANYLTEEKITVFNNRKLDNALNPANKDTCLMQQAPYGTLKCESIKLIREVKQT